MNSGGKQLSQAQDCWSGSVFVWDRRTFYLGSASDTTMHASHEIKVCVAVHGSFRLRMAGEARWKTYTAAIIPSNQLHQLDGRGAQLSLLYFSPETLNAQRLVYSDRRAHPVPQATLARFVPLLRRYLDRGCSEDEATELCGNLVNELIPSATARVSLDFRVAGALEYLQSGTEGQPTAAQISSEVALSPGRLAHLFSAQMGLPIRRYVLSLRLRRAVQRMAREDSLTDVAHEVGFADSAHLSRTFRRMVGLAPSALIKSSHFFRI